MTKSPRFLIACMIAVAGLLNMASESQAQIWRGRMARRSVYPPGWPNRMPGWDWKYMYPYVERRSMYPPGWDERYIYPWSPYNIGRNPYNPGYFEYPPAYAGYPVNSASAVQSAGYQEPAYGTETAASQMLPDPTGAMTTAPPTAALIRIRVPDAFAEVEFDGVKTESVGRTRYYVTPDLTSDQPFSYEVTARWQGGEGLATETRKIEVRRGQITTLDFTRKQTAGR
jgi:uncharacterized protein (TIGR03000 family)